MLLLSMGVLNWSKVTAKTFCNIIKGQLNAVLLNLTIH